VRLLFDGHVDLALFALAYNRDQTEPVAVINERERGMTDADERGRATVSLPELRRAAAAVCQSSLAARANREVRPSRRLDLDFGTQAMAYASAQGQLSYYRMLEEQGEVTLLRSANELELHWQHWEAIVSQLTSADTSSLDQLPVGVIVSMECADPIVEPAQAESWWKDGLRSVMLAHFGHSHYAAGTGVSGPLTTKGIELVKAFSRLGMILDLSHLCDESFYDALDRFDGPVIASHNNCRALVPGDRQLTDEQIRLLIERDAVIGSVLDAWMLVPGWVHGQSTPGQLTLAAVVDHLDHVCQLAGNAQHAAIGSDPGGTNHMPSDFKTTADLQALSPLLADRGYSETDIDNIFHGNWLRYFRRWLPRS
jgi:membrane dipeptidase